MQIAPLAALEECPRRRLGFDLQSVSVSIFCLFSTFCEELDREGRKEEDELKDRCRRQLHDHS